MTWGAGASYVLGGVFVFVMIPAALILWRRR